MHGLRHTCASLSIAAGLGVGLLFGLTNGVLVTVMELPPLLAKTMVVPVALQQILFDGTQDLKGLEDAEPHPWASEPVLAMRQKMAMLRRRVCRPRLTNA